MMRAYTTAFLFSAFFGMGLLRAEDNAFAGRRPPISAEESYPIHGSDLLWKQEAELRRYLARHPEAKQAGLPKQSRWGFSVGSAHEWFATDFTTKADYTVSSVCRAVGEHCYIFVEDAVWGTRVHQADVDSVREAFEHRTPADAMKGIYATDAEAFGTPPDVDRDPRIILLLLDIKDGYSGTGGYVSGYFNPWNEMDQPGSNIAEIIFLDVNPLDLTTAGGRRICLSTTVHEFQHMIHWKYDASENPFINEGCSLIAEVHAGYPMYPQDGFLHETNHYLLDWRFGDGKMVLNDYSRAARFAMYLRDRFGMSFFKKLVASDLTAEAGIVHAMAVSGCSESFADLVQDFALANIVNDRAIDVKYGYLSPAIRTCSATPITTPAYWTGTTPDQIEAYGTLYLHITVGTDIKATFASDRSISVKAFEVGPSGKRILDCPRERVFAEPLFGSAYTDLYFAITNRTSARSPVSSTILGRGSFVELRWDEKEPAVASSSIAATDSICVTFDGVPGARLDSFRVALNGTGALVGTVWSIVNTTARPSFIYPLASSLGAESESDVSDAFPVSVPKWITFDLRSRNIDASGAFAVVLGNRSSSLAWPGVMASAHSGAGHHHSWIYMHAPGIGLRPNWYYELTPGRDSAVLYRIRAYVSFDNVTHVGRAVELIPAAARLDQNYPNPFNASTTIHYSLAASRLISLRIYDVLGREVAALVSGVKPPGVYTVEWNASAQPSGVYFCRLQAGSDTQTKRLILQK
ncbi:MAG: T9SS type A sorting domain-containing protein [Acidobacteriota bacterium]